MICVTATNLDENRRDPTDHPLQECIGGDVDRHLRASAPDPDPVNGPNRRRAHRRPEGGEVVPAHQDRRSIRHRCSIERDPNRERIALAKRASRSVPHGVPVLPVPCRVAGVEPCRRRSHVANRDVRWKERVQRSSQLLGRETSRIGERDHLVRGMHPGVGPACSIDSQPRSAVELGECRFELPLDRPRSRLGLEPGEVCPIVFNPCGVTHGGVLSNAFTASSPLRRAQCKAPPSRERERTWWCVSACAEAATRK